MPGASGEQDRRGRAAVGGRVGRTPGPRQPSVRARSEDTMAGTRALAVCAAALGIITTGAAAHAGTTEVRCEAAADNQTGTRVVKATQRTGPLTIAGGYDGKRVWIDADIRELGIRKFVTRRASSSPAAGQIELHYKGDAVVIGLADGAITVGRGNRTIRVDSLKDFERV